MKFIKLLTLSSAAIAMAMAGTASAFVPDWNVDKDNPDGTDTGTVTIWHGGASASTFSAQIAVVSAFCSKASPVHVLEDARVVGKPEFWAVACQGRAAGEAMSSGAVFPAAPASIAGKKLLWNKRDEGGSGVGVGPLATNPPTAVGFMKPSVANCPADSGTKNYDLDGDGIADIVATLRNCTAFSVPVDACDESATTDCAARVPEIGTSDIEPSKFEFTQNVPVADLNLDGNQNNDALGGYDTTVLTDQGLAQLIFNTPVNLLMYQDLQRVQFPTGHPLNADCNPAGANYGLITDRNANANSEKCMPSLTGNEIRSILMQGGAIRKSQDFQAEQNFGNADFAEVVATGVTDTTIQICRRVPGSGTQAQANAIMLGYPCDPTGDNAIDTLVPESEGGFTTFVVNNSGSGDVEKCLNDFNDGANATGKNSAARKRWAIGVQSLEKNANISNRYRFIKIDGFAPTLANAHAGDYYDVARQSIQVRTGTAPVNVDAMNSIAQFIDACDKLAGLNAPLVHPFGASGWLGSPRAGQSPDSILDLTCPVAWFQRVSFGGKANTCALPSAFKKTALTPDANNPDTVSPVAITVSPQNCSNNGDADGNCYTP